MTLKMPENTIYSHGQKVIVFKKRGNIYEAVFKEYKNKEEQ